MLGGGGVVQKGWSGGWNGFERVALVKKTAIKVTFIGIVVKISFFHTV